MAILKKEEFILNSIRIGTQFDPRITYLAQNKLAVAWVNKDGFANGVVVGIYDTLTHTFNGDINSTLRYPLPVQDIVRLNNDGQNASFLVTRINPFSPVSEGTFLEGTFFYSDGYDDQGSHSLNGDVPVSDTGGSSTAVLGDLTFYTFATPNSAQNADITGILHGNERSPISDPLILNSTTEGLQTNPDTASIDGEGFIAAWESTDSGTSQIRARIFDFDLNAKGQDFLVSTMGSNPSSDPEVAVLTSKKIVVAWDVKNSASGNDVHARFYDHVGKALTNDIIVNTGVTGNQTKPMISALPDGRAVMVWLSEIAGSGFRVMANIIDADGNLAGGEFGVGYMKGRTSGSLDVTVSENSKIFVSWDSYIDKINGRDIKTAILDPTKVLGSEASNFLRGGSLAEKMSGLGGNDKLYGFGGNDSLFGGAGNDRLSGQKGNDKLSGEDGNDVLIGGIGKDSLAGGDGSDKFLFGAIPSNSNIDQILDFDARFDLVGLDNAVFSKFINERIDSTNFVRASNAKDESDRLIYNSKTGELIYDPDGIGNGAASTIASIGKNIDLKAEDFFVF